MFNIINRNSPEHWAAIRELVTSTEGPLVASQNHPEGLPFAKWARNLGVLRIPSAEACAEAVVRSLGAQVWMTGSGHPEVISAANGGAGSYEWDRDAARTRRGPGTSSRAGGATASGARPRAGRRRPADSVEPVH